MQRPASSPRRTGLIVLGIVALLVIVAILWRVGVSDGIIVGLAAGLGACLIIVGLDRLHGAERRLTERERPPDGEPPRDPPS